MQDTGYEKEGITKATIGEGTIIVGGEVQEDLDGLNRDVNNVQEITKDMITGALDGSVTIDNRIFTSKGWDSIKSDFENLPENAKITVNAIATLPDKFHDAAVGAYNKIVSNNPGATFEEVKVADEQVSQQIKEELISNQDFENEQEAKDFEEKIEDKEVIEVKLDEETGEQLKTWYCTDNPDYCSGRVEKVYVVEDAIMLYIGGKVVQYVVSKIAKELFNDATSQAKFPENPSQTQHIFRNAEGHFSVDTPQNREVIQNTINPDNFQGIAQGGKEVYTQTLSDGKQVWVEVRNGIIQNAGINDIPRNFTPGGLK